MKNKFLFCVSNEYIFQLFIILLILISVVNYTNFASLLLDINIIFIKKDSHIISNSKSIKLYAGFNSK